MKSRSCWPIFTLVGLFLTSCGQQKSSQEIAETVKNSIVLISYQNEGGHGTGFIVPGPTGVCTVLTARHVVEGRSLNLQTNDQKLWKTDSIQASPNLDLAVVTFQSADKNCPYPSLNLGDSDTVKQSDQIYISGFPDRNGSGKLVQQFVRGSVSGLDVLEQGYGISYDASTFGGMSGGPVLDVRGKVVAVHGKVDAFKWGIPIKTYLANQSDLMAKADSVNIKDLIAKANIERKKQRRCEIPALWGIQYLEEVRNECGDGWALVWLSGVIMAFAWFLQGVGRLCSWVVDKIT